MTEEQKHEQSIIQPLWATVALGICTLSGIVAIVIVRLYTTEVPLGLVAITTSLATGLVMASGRRRF